MELATPLNQDPELAHDLDRLRELMHAGDIEGARAHIRAIAPKWPESDYVQHWAKVLAPPVARRVPRDERDRDRDREHQWMKEHETDFPGCWVALDGDRIIAVSRSLDVVLDAVKQDEAELPYVFLQPEPA